MVESVEPLRKLVGLALHIACILARYGNDPADAFGNATLFQNDELLDLVNWRLAYPTVRTKALSLLDSNYLARVPDVSPTAKLDTDFSPI